MHAILTDLCSIPTAPFAEDRVYAYVDEFVRRRPKLKLSRDRFGNRLIELRGASPKPPRLVFVAHTDHPGFVATRMLDRLVGEPRPFDRAADLIRNRCQQIELLTGQAAPAAHRQVHHAERPLAGVERHAGMAA